jgi:hypothetical protein
MLAIFNLIPARRWTVVECYARLYGIGETTG